MAAGILVSALPLLGLWAIAFLLERRQARRTLEVRQQVAVTDAIYRELGAAAAPVVTHRGRRLTVAVALALDDPFTVAIVVRIIRDTLAPGAHARRLEIVVTAREPDASARRSRPRNAMWIGPVPARAA